MAHKITKQIYKVLLDKGFHHSFINQIDQKDLVIEANIHLPKHKDISDLEKILPNLQQELGATAVKLGKANGKSVKILFGMNQLSNINFDEKMLREYTLEVEFPSAYGTHVLNFEDGSSCHLLNGGVTRMGKTCFLLYTATTIFLQTKGDCQFYISSAKLKDYYPFQDIPQVSMARTHDEMELLLNDIIAEYKYRDELLYSPLLKKATDAKSVREIYPQHYHLFKPVFLFIDEYARFADSKPIQDAVTEIVETAGFVNVHVIIASQRPDASSVLKPRIRANLLARMAFTTADKKNSEVILDREGAEKLGRIAGRGLLIDSDSHVIQVPYLTAQECDKLLEPYQKESTGDEQIRERFIDSKVTDKIQSMLKESDSLSELQGESESSECSESGIEENVIEWSDFANTKGEG